MTFKLITLTREKSTPRQYANGQSAKSFSFNPFSLKHFSFLSVFLLILGCSTAGMAEFKEGTHYSKVEDANPGTGDKVQVIEFFNYACPHCNNLEPMILKWTTSSKPEFIEFEHMPAFWNPLFENAAKAFYTAQALGESEKMHPVLFSAIHDKGVNFSNVDAIQSVFVNQGIDAEKFKKSFESFYVNQKMNTANKLFAQYKLRSVPSFVIDGQWRTSLQEAGSHEALFEVIQYLSEKAKNSR